MLGDLCCLMAWAVWSLDIAFRLDLYLVLYLQNTKKEKLCWRNLKKLEKFKECLTPIQVLLQ